MSVAKSNTAQIPWTRYNSSFTLLFDRWVMQLVKEMPVKPASRIVWEHGTRLWRIVHHYVDQALEKQDLSQVRHIAVDETRRKEHQERLANLSDSHLKTAKAYQLKIAFQAFWGSSLRIAPLHLQIWYEWAMRSRIPDMVKAAKRKARGYRTTRYLIAIIYLIGGKFDL